MKSVPLSRVFLTDEVRAAALSALDSGRYILASECAAFERELAAHVGVRHCVLVSSCTAAFLLLHHAMDLGPGDEVILPSHTAFPSVESLVHVGARPVFVEVDEAYGVDPAAIEKAITPRTAGIIAVHLYGQPTDMDRILATARARRLWVVEDCAQAHGARHGDVRVGALGTAGVFSFYPSKNLTVCGDGGCVMTNDDAIAERVRMLRDHGRRTKFTHELVGFNLRFNEIQAAIGRVMLRHLDRLNAARQRIARRYDERLAGLVGIPSTRPATEPVYHLYVIRTPERDALAAFLRESGIETGIHYPIANHRQPAITKRFGQAALPRTEALVNEILSLPMYGEMSMEDADYVCDRIAAFFAAR